MKLNWRFLMNRDFKNVTTSMYVTKLPAMFIAIMFLLVLFGSCRTPDYSSTEPVGEMSPQRYITPVNQVLTPIGIQVELPGMRPQALALSPDGSLLVTSGKTQELVLMDPQTGHYFADIPVPPTMTIAPACAIFWVCRSPWVKRWSAHWCSFASADRFILQNTFTWPSSLPLPSYLIVR